MDKHTTDELLKVLNSIDSTDGLSAYAGDKENLSSYGSFSDFLKEAMAKADVSAGELIEAANIHRTYGYQIIEGIRNPGRDKVISICLALALPLKEAQRALKLAGESVLYPKARRDSILIFCVNKKLTVRQANDLLFEMGEKTLG